MHQWRSYSIWLLVHKTLIPTHAFLLTLFVTEGGGILLSTFDLNTLQSLLRLVKIDRGARDGYFSLISILVSKEILSNEWQIGILYTRRTVTGMDGTLHTDF